MKRRFESTQSVEHLTLLGYNDGDRVYLRTITQAGQAANLDTTYPNLSPLPTDANVYIVVNGGGHKDADVTECRAVFYEHDDLDKQVQRDLWQSLGLPEPTFQIDTGGKSVHSYWIFIQPIPITEWRSLQSDLLEFADADRSIKNPSRVMRLAGSIHQATGEQATIISQSGQRYPYEQLRAAIPKQAKPKRKQRPRQAVSAGVLPLTVVLDPANRTRIESGIADGSRNTQGAALARDLIGCENWLRASGIHYEGNAEGLFQDYCDRCNPPIEDRERDTIWRSAVGDNPTPTFSVDKLVNCVTSWQKKAKSATKSRAIAPDDESPESEDEATGTKAERESAAQKLIKIGQRCFLFHTADKVAYADVTISDVRHTYRVRSGDFKRWLSQTIYLENEIAANSEAMNSALNVLEAQAFFDGEEMEVHLRTAQHDGSIYIDLANERWEAVKVSPDGTWAIVSSSPVRFLRPATMLPLPTPTRDGSLKALRELLNVDGHAWVLLITFILFSMVPGQTYPVLLLSACRGSGKTTAAEILKGLIDPSKAGLIGLSADAHKAAVAGSNRWLMVYDNVSHISPEASDTLCRISTGFGFSTRTLFSTGDETVFELSRPQILTAIDHVVVRDDLSDRLITVNLPEISPEKRIQKTELDAKIAKLQPGILGALLAVLAQTLRSQHLGRVKVEKLPRMADFGAFALHAEQHLGLVEGGFIAAFDESREVSRQVVLEASPIAEAIALMLNRNGDFKGAVSVLHKQLEEFLEESVVRSRLWPKASNGLSRALNRLKPDLKAVGIEVSDSREGKAGARMITIAKNDRADIKPKTSSVSSATGSKSLGFPQAKVSTADDKADDNEKSSSAEGQVSSADGGLADDTLKADDRLTIKNTLSSATQNHKQQAIQGLADDTDDKSTRLSGQPNRAMGVIDDNDY